MPDIFFLVSAAVLAAGASWSVVCHFSFMPCYSLSPLLSLFSFRIPGDGHVSPVTDMATTASSGVIGMQVTMAEMKI